MAAGLACFMRRRTSTPSMPGSTMSSRVNSGFSSAKTLSAKLGTTVESFAETAGLDPAKLRECANGHRKDIPKPKRQRSRELCNELIFAKEDKIKEHISRVYAPPRTAKDIGQALLVAAAKTQGE